MNFKIFIILLILIFGVGTASLLDPNGIAIWLQGLKVFNSLGEVIDPNCICENPANPSEMGPQFCPTDANGDVIGDPNFICTWPAHNPP